MIEVHPIITAGLMIGIIAEWIRRRSALWRG